MINYLIMYSLPIATHANARLTRRDCGPPRGRRNVTRQKTGRRAWPRTGKRRTRTRDGLPVAAPFAAAARARRRRAWSCRSRSSPWSCHNARGGDARRRAPACGALVTTNGARELWPWHRGRRGRAQRVGGQQREWRRGAATRGTQPAPRRARTCKGIEREWVF